MRASDSGSVRVRPVAQSAAQPAALAGPAQRETQGRALGRLAAAAIAASIFLMVGAVMVRGSWMTPALPLPASGPPWQLAVHVPAVAVVTAIWLAAGLGGAGIAAGLVAARRGVPFPVRALLAAAAIGIVALVFLPAAGSTDALDYAVYGHIAAAGHSPYVMTPAQFGHRQFLAGVSGDWQHRTSVYGPLATAEQMLAAKLGPGSLAATVFWLKVVNAVAFAAIAFAAHRLLRADPASRLRAHLLWTANPLLLWTVVAAGHLDVLAAAAGLAGLLIADRLIADRWIGGARIDGARIGGTWIDGARIGGTWIDGTWIGGWRPAARRLACALAAGACVGVAVDIKASYALFGLALAWSLRQRPGQLLTAAAGAAAVLLPSFALAGWAAVKSVLGAPGGRGVYAVLMRNAAFLSGHVLPIAGCLAVAAAVLTLWRMPPGFGHRTAIRAAVAVSLSLLLVWPEQYAWYDVMVVCVLVFYPASRLDWLVLAWLTVSTFSDMPGLGGSDHSLGSVLPAIHNASFEVLEPVVIAAILAVLVVLCVTRRWHADPAARLPRPRVTATIR